MNEAASEAKSGKVRRFITLMLVAAVGAGGVYAYREFTKLDRALDAVGDGTSVYWENQEDWDFLIANAVDPRVQAKLRKLLKKTAQGNVQYTSSVKSGIRVLEKGLRLNDPKAEDPVVPQLVFVYLKKITEKAGPNAGAGYRLNEYWMRRWFDTATAEKDAAGAILKYATDFVAKSKKISTDDSQLLARALHALEAYGAANEVAFANILSVGLAFGSVDLEEITELAGRFFADKSNWHHIPDAHAAALARAAAQKEKLRMKHFDVIAHQLLFVPPPRNDGFLGDLVFQCAHLVAIECGQIAHRIDGAATQLSQMANAEIDAKREAYARALAALVRYWREPGMLAQLFAVGQKPPYELQWKNFDPSKEYSRMDKQFPARLRTERIYAALLEQGRAVVPSAYRAFAVGNRGTAHISARLLAQLDPRQFSTTLLKRIEGFTPTAAAFVQHKFKKGQARRYFRDGDAVSEGLLAVAAQKVSDDTVAPLILALSIADPAYSKFASETLRRKLDRDRFADSLFTFLARRSRFRWSEINAYVDALGSYKDPSSAVERNLARLLQRAGDVPDKVFWIHKIIGLKGLAKYGASSALPLLDQYGQDKKQYISTKSVYRDGRTEYVQSREKFADLAAAAIKEIRQSGR